MHLIGYYETTCSNPYLNCPTEYVGGRAKLQVVSGQDYLIRAAVYQSIGRGLMNLTCTPMLYNLSNDECGGATPIPAGEQIFYDPTFATNQQVLDFQAPYRDQWFSWVASCTGVLKFRSSSQGGVAFMSNCATQLGVSRYSDAQQAQVVAGTQYFFRAGLSSYYHTLSSYYFNMSCLASPPNDKEAGAIPWPGTVGVYFNYSTEGASTDTCYNDLWYTWTATCTGMARLTACGSEQYSYSPYIALQALSGPTPLPHPDPSSPGFPRQLKFYICWSTIFLIKLSLNEPAVPLSS